MCPAQCFEMPLLPRDDFPLADELPRRGVDRRERVGALVDISSNHNHPVRPFQSMVSR